HAIGGGIVLFEIQQNSDVTYRLWDYGRPREIHVDKAVPISDLTVHPGAVNPVPLDSKCERLVTCPHFVTERCRLITASRFTAPAGQFWLCLDGEGDIAGDCYQPGDVFFLETPSQIFAESESRFLRTSRP